MPVRVRFAPSPTGYLHVGGLRTAIYNYLFARHHKGKFILRIEDTDRSRYVENAQENLIKSLRWACIDYDEGPDVGGNYGPYIQSQRTGIYKKHADILLDNGNAYIAFDTPEEIEQMRERLQKEGKDPRYDRMSGINSITLSENEVQQKISDNVPFVIRLKVPEDFNVNFKDIIRGEITVNTHEIDDQVLVKSDGFPTYHLANVVDDHLMEISHVIRGEEWLPSTPKHILLYKAFGWEPPQFAHLPLLLNENKSKLSKRHGSVAVEDFRSQGYFRDAFVNFIALLGWNPTGDREIYEFDELINAFDINKVNKGGAVFDVQKLNWMNAQYMKTLPKSLVIGKIKPYLEKKGYDVFDKKYIFEVIDLVKERVTFAKEIPDYADYMFEEPKEYETAYFEKHWQDETDIQVYSLLEDLKNVPEESFNHDTLNAVTKEWCEKNDLKMKIIIHPLRLMITGKSFGPGMFQLMEVLGKEKCVMRIKGFMEKKEKGLLAV